MSSAGGALGLVELALFYWLGPKWWTILLIATVAAIFIGITVYQYYVRPKNWDGK